MSEGRLLQYASEREHGRRSTAAEGTAALHERDLSLIRRNAAARPTPGRGPAALLAAARRGLETAAVAAHGA
jgi:hypothetical protein